MKQLSLLFPVAALITGFSSNFSNTQNAKNSLHESINKSVNFSYKQNAAFGRNVEGSRINFAIADTYTLHNPGKCKIDKLPEVTFKPGSAKLDKIATAALGSIIEQLEKSPECKLRIVGYAASSRVAQQLQWDRVDAIVKYLTRNGIVESKIEKTYSNERDSNLVLFEGF